MTKSEKRQTVLALLKQLVEADEILREESLVENIIIEIYSCGYDSIGKLNIVSDGIKMFLTDIMNQKLKHGTKNWETTDSIIGLLGLINLSKLPE